MLQINTIEELTNEFILEISDEMFKNTVAYKAFKTAQIFISKIHIHDKALRYSMIKNIIKIEACQLNTSNNYLDGSLCLNMTG